MIDYLNQHHVYIDAQNAPDLSMEAKTDQTDNQNRQGCPYCSWIDPALIEDDEVDGPMNYCRVCGRDVREARDDKVRCENIGYDGSEV